VFDVTGIESFEELTASRVSEWIAPMPECSVVVLIGQAVQPG
jgi:hypothetical protein